MTLSASRIARRVPPWPSSRGAASSDYLGCLCVSIPFWCDEISVHFRRAVTRNLNVWDLMTSTQKFCCTLLALEPKAQYCSIYAVSTMSGSAAPTYCSNALGLGLILKIWAGACHSYHGIDLSADSLCSTNESHLACPTVSYLL